MIKIWLRPLNILRGVSKVLEGSIISIKQKSRTWRHNLRLTEEKFKKNIKKYYFNGKVVEAWNQLPAEVNRQ